MSDLDLLFDAINNTDLSDYRSLLYAKDPFHGKWLKVTWI